MGNIAPTLIYPTIHLSLDKNNIEKALLYFFSFHTRSLPASGLLPQFDLPQRQVWFNNAPKPFCIFV